jgi:hypothetical protein
MRRKARRKQGKKKGGGNCRILVVGGSPAFYLHLCFDHLEQILVRQVKLVARAGACAPSCLFSCWGCVMEDTLLIGLA